MSDWENDFDEEEPVVPIIKKKWDDEDVEDDIKESWEESDEEEEKPKPAAAPAKKKIPLAQKIAERQAEEERKKQELEAKRIALVCIWWFCAGKRTKLTRLVLQAGRQQPETDEEAFERKEREKRLQIESDIQNASDLFSGVAVDGKQLSGWQQHKVHIH